MRLDNGINEAQQSQDENTWIPSNSAGKVWMLRRHNVLSMAPSVDKYVGRPE